MAKPDALKRLGGGRWETRDGRFTIEPQSGTWVIVDSTQTNDFGLPLVRGPFASLTAARDAIETTREDGPIRSPLADRVEQASHQKPPAARSGSGARTRRKPEPEPEAEPEPEPPAESAPPPEPEPEEPPEPAWLADLTLADRRKAKALATRLEALDIEDPWAIVHAELVDGQPALARLAIERRLASVRRTKAQRAQVDEVLEWLVAGTDDDLGVEWRLVDGRDRSIRDRDLEDQD